MCITCSYVSYQPQPQSKPLPVLQSDIVDWRELGRKSATAARHRKADARREQVARLVGMGLTRREIADRLGVSIETIRADKLALGLTGGKN